MEWEGQAKTELTADGFSPVLLVQHYSNMDYAGT